MDTKTPPIILFNHSLLRNQSVILNIEREGGGRGIRGGREWEGVEREGRIEG